jgi:hypothetical protein
MVSLDHIFSLIDFLRHYFSLELEEEGFYALFPPGPEQNISNTTYCSPSLRIQFNCNPDVLWFAPLDKNATALAPDPIDIDVNQTEKCEVMKFE